MTIATSPTLDRYGRQVSKPIPPPWFSDAVEEWARLWGRHATTRWEPRMGCFVTFFSRRDTDPVLKGVKEGTRHDEGEPFYWHEWKEGIRPHPLIGPSKMIGGFRHLDIEQMGESGVTTMLEKGNMWSGRGEHASIGAAVDAHESAIAAQKEAQRQTLRDGLRDPLRATIRHARGLPQVSVPDDIIST